MNKQEGFLMNKSVKVFLFSFLIMAGSSYAEGDFFDQFMDMVKKNAPAETLSRFLHTVPSSQMRQFLNQKNDLEETALYWTVYWNNVESTKTLLSKGASPNVPLYAGETVLHLAVKKGYKEIIETLLSSHINLNVQDDFGNTALHYAAQYGYHEITSLLLNAGANPNFKNHYDCKALDNARKSNHPRIINILRGRTYRAFAECF